MAFEPFITPRVRPHLARINPTWQAAPYLLADLAPFFTGRGSAPAVTASAPKRPAPEMTGLASRDAKSGYRTML